MKLRNKKTGEIKEYTHTMTSYHVPIKGGYEIFTPWKPEEWEELEDVKGPLIKDEKIRKAVRAWAKTIKAKSAFVEKPSYERADLILSDNFAAISFPIDKPKELDFCKRYTIEELCGEEEE